MHRSRLEKVILIHWQTHRPELVRELIHTKTLQPSLRAAEELATDLLHEYLSIQKMEYVEAWDQMMRALLPTSSQNPSPREISESLMPTG